ncbi:MAG: acyl-CoA dehydrogenase family protein [Halobacteriales archaeon]
MDFESSDRVRELKGRADELIAEVIDPLEAEHAEWLGKDMEQTLVGDDDLLIDAYWDVAERIRKEAVDHGIYNCIMPEEYGGMDLSWVEFEQLVEHLHDRRNPGLHRNAIAHSSTPFLFNFDDSLWDDYIQPVLDGEALMAFAMTEETAGSDPQYMETTAEKDGDEWVINGLKKYVTEGPYADFHVVFARTSGDPGDNEGITPFIVDPDQPGVEMPEVHKVMGGLPRDHSYYRYDDVRVPEHKVVGEVDKGLTSGMEWINYGKVYDAARAVGISQWLLDTTIEYAKERQTWDVPLAERQAIRHKLGEMDRKIKRTRWLTRRACWELDKGGRTYGWQGLMKVEEAKTLNEVADEAVQIHGGKGFDREHPIEWVYRHARVYRIWEGAEEVMRNQHASSLIDHDGMNDE